MRTLKENIMPHVIIAEPGSLQYDNAILFITEQYVKKHNCHLTAKPSVIYVLYEGDVILGTMGLALDSSRPYAFEYCNPPHVAERFQRGTPRKHLAEFTRYALAECDSRETVFAYGKILLEALCQDARARGITHLGFMGKASLLTIYNALHIPVEILGTPTFESPAEGEQFGTYAQQENMHVFGAYL